MEAKKILGLIKDDIAHLEEITREFSVELLPSADDMELAILRARALLTELELLQKLTSLKNLEPCTVPNTEFQMIKIHSPVDNVKEAIEKIEATVVHDKMHDPIIEAADFLHADIELEVNKGNNPHHAVLEHVTTDNELPIVKGPKVQNETLTANDHKKDLTNPIAIEGQKSINETLRKTRQGENDFLPNENSSLGYPITPIKLIWDAVGINDRFLFVRELFDNDSSKFESTVRTIDELTSIQEAVNYLKMNFKWNNSEASQRFLILVKQRFTK